MTLRTRYTCNWPERNWHSTNDFWLKCSKCLLPTRYHRLDLSRRAASYRRRYFKLLRRTTQVRPAPYFPVTTFLSQQPEWESHRGHVRGPTVVPSQYTTELSYMRPLRCQPFGPGIIFLVLAQPVYKMRIIQEPNTIELWNKLHFEEEKNGEYIPCLKYSVPIFVE